MATGPGPVGFRHGSDSLSTIQGGADQLLADGEVRPFSPGYGPAANPGESLWVDPNAAPAGTSPFGLDDACVDEDYQDPNMAAPSGGGGGGGTTDHRNLTHRNDANQHTGDAINVTTTFPGDGSASTKTLTDAMAAVIAAVSDGATEVYIPRYIVGQVHETTANLYVNNAVEPVTDGLTIADADGLLVLLIDGYDTAVTTDLAGAPGSLTAPAPDGLYVTNASTDDDGSQGVIFIVKDGKANRAAPPYPTVGARYIEPFLIDGVALDSESGFWGPLFDLFGGTTGTWDNPEFPDGNSISLATPSVEQQTLGYTAKWKLNLSPLNRGQGLKGLHFSGAGVEGGDCAWLVTDASDVAVAGGGWGQGRKSDPGSTFGFPGKAIVAGGGDGSLTDMYFDNVIYPEEGEPFYLQLAMSHFWSPYEGVMSVDLIVTPIWEGIEEVYVPGNGPHWESLDPGDPEVPETKREGLDLLVHTVVDLLDTVATKADLASPALTGNPTAPTQAQGNNTTRIATTEFVHTEASLLVPKALVDAKGDLLVATAPDTVARLPVGTDGQVLVADSAQTPGVKWASATAGITNGVPRVLGDTARAFTIPGVIPVNGLSTTTPSSNRTVFQPIRLDKARTYDQIQLEVTAASVSGSRCRTAIYAVDDYWQATDLLFDSGQMANDAIAVVTAGISLTLPAGDYMMVTVSQGSATFRVMTCLPPWRVAFKAGAGVAGFLNVFTAGGNSNVANGFPATADSTVKFEGATGTITLTINYYARLREAA